MVGRPPRSATSRLRTAAQLVAEIERRIATGQLAPGHRLDPVRDLAQQLGLAPNTVAAAYRTLGERGLVVGQGRRGTFVAARPVLTLTGDEPVPDGLVDLTSGNPDPALLPQLGPALARIPTRPVLYGEPAVDGDLAALLRDDLAADGIRTDRLALVAGALDGLERVLAAHVRPGDRVGVEDPGYPSVIELTLAMGLRPVPVAVDEMGPTAEGLEAALAAGAAAVVVTPRAHNPTGAALDAGRSAELAAVLLTAPDVLVVEDDHAGRVAGQPYVSLVSPDTQRWAVVRSMAKSLGPDLRLAAIAGDDVTISRVARRQLLGPGWVPHLVQQVVLALLADPATHELLARASAAYARRRQLMVDGLAQGGITITGRSGLNVWVPVDDEARVVAGMQRRGFAVRSGARFRQVAGPGIRISTASAQTGTLVAAASALVEVVGGLEQLDDSPRARSV